MPYKKGYSDETREKNITNEIRSGMDPKNAVAMAYRIQRETAKQKHRSPRVPWGKK